MTARRPIPLLLAALVLPACAPGFSADIANHSQRPIFVAVFEQSPRAGSRMLASASIAPDDRKTVGASATSDSAQVFAVIDTTPNPKTARRIPLSQGTTRFEVVQFGDDPKAPIQINQLP